MNENVMTGTQCTQIDIRDAEISDAIELSELMTTLGYKTTEDEMRSRFAKILNHEDYKTVVATIKNQIVAVIGMSKNLFYEQNGIYVRVLALVTSENFRRKGIGKKLMVEAENWAQQIGASTILLNCGNRKERTEAQNFYQKIGYQIKTSGFIKKLEN